MRTWCELVSSLSLLLSKDAERKVMKGMGIMGGGRITTTAGNDELGWQTDRADLQRS